MKKVKITLAAVLLAAGAGYSALLLDVNFESGTNGFAPAADYVRPLANSTTQAIQVVNSTLLGGSKAVQFLDRAVNTATSSSLQYNFASNGAVVLSFSFSPSYVGGTSANYLDFGLGQQATISAAGNLFCTARFRADGKVGFVSGGSSVATSAALAAGSSNTISIFVNDTDSAIIYAGGTLAANTADYWLNGSLAYAGASFGTTVSALGTTNGMGRVAIFDATTRTDLDYMFDNITVAAIPEPATIGMVMLGALALFGIRRYQR